MSRVVKPTRGFHTNIPENLLVVSHHLELYGREAVRGGVNVRVGEVGRETAEADMGGVNCAAHVGEGGDFVERSGGFVEATAAGGDLDEFGVKFGSE